MDVTVKNVSGSIAFFNQLQFLNQDLKPIRPSFYTDNFFSLMPGESKSVVIETNAEKITETPVLVVKGWNVDRKQINKERNEDESKEKNLDSLIEFAISFYSSQCAACPSVPA